MTFRSQPSEHLLHGVLGEPSRPSRGPSRPPMRRIEGEERFAVRRKHPSYLAHEAVQAGDVFEDLSGDHQVEAGRLEELIQGIPTASTNVDFPSLIHCPGTRAFHSVDVDRSEVKTSRFEEWLPEIERSRAHCADVEDPESLPLPNPTFQLPLDSYFGDVPGQWRSKGKSLKPTRRLNRFSDAGPLLDVHQRMLAQPRNIRRYDAAARARSTYDRDRLPRFFFAVGGTIGIQKSLNYPL